MPTKTQTPLSPARTQLKQTLEAKQRAQVLVDKAQRVVDAANVALEQARAESAKCEESHEDAIKSRLALLKGEPGKSQDQIRESQRARLLAKEELTASDETFRAAQQELEDARGNVSRSEKVAASHCVAALSEAINDVIPVWDAVNAEKERLRVILGCLIVAPIHDGMPIQQQQNAIQSVVSQARLPFGDLQDWKHLQNKVGAALSRNYAQPDPGPSIARARKYWAGFSDAIQANPSIEQPPLPGGSELFD